MRSKVFCLVFLGCLISATNGYPSGNGVLWYRTAQYTSDRITQQSDLIFGEDFNHDQTIKIQRYRYDLLYININIVYMWLAIFDS